MKLQVKNISKHFDGVRALQEVSFAVATGECVALIGPNGAGKSTAFACIAGQHKCDTGWIGWAGQRIDTLAPAQRLHRGVARTFQVAQTFEALSVRQNVQLLLQAPHRLSAWQPLDALHITATDALLARVGLGSQADADVQGLPYGAKKRLELALALAGLAALPGPGLLLLDEPAAGLAQVERAELMALVQSLAHPQPGTGVAALAVLYSEHNMDAVFGIADRVLVLVDGVLVAQGSAAEVAHNPVAQERYLGLAGAAALSSNPPTEGSHLSRREEDEHCHCERNEAIHDFGQHGLPRFARSDDIPVQGPCAVSGRIREACNDGLSPILAVQKLDVWYGGAQALFAVSLQVGRAEMVVLQGLNGAGKSTLLQALMGLGQRVQGQVAYDGVDISAWPTHRRARAGLGYVAENRRLFAELTVHENLTLAARGASDPRACGFDEARVLDLFPALKPMLQRRASQMSGGEQQMLALGRTLMTSPRLLLLDEPCEGIAPLLVERIVATLVELQADGMTILAAEQNRLLASHATRVITLVAGQIKS